MGGVQNRGVLLEEHVQVAELLRGRQEGLVSLRARPIDKTHRVRVRVRDGVRVRVRESQG